MPFIKLIPVLLILLLTGCVNSTGGTSTNGVSPYTSRQDAVGTLLDQAWSAQSKGDYMAADGWLVRAMRINPTEPAVYYHMALLRKEQGKPEQARQLASRALSLDPDRSMKRELDLFLRQL